MAVFPKEVIAFRGRVAEYPVMDLFHSAERYPECRFETAGEAPCSTYAGGERFYLARPHEAHFGTAEWNGPSDLMRHVEVTCLEGRAR